MASQEERRGAHGARWSVWSPAALGAVALVALAGLAAFVCSVAVLARGGGDPAAPRRADTRSLLAAAETGAEAETEIAELGARAGPGQGRAGDGREQGQGRGSLSGRVARAVSDGWAGRGLSA